MLIKELSLGGPAEGLHTNSAEENASLEKLLYHHNTVQHWEATPFTLTKSSQRDKASHFLPFSPPPPFSLPLCPPRYLVKALYCACAEDFLSVSLLLEAAIHSLCLCIELTQTATKLVAAHTINPPAH